jgi:hypothetical protein
MGIVGRLVCSILDNDHLRITMIVGSESKKRLEIISKRHMQFHITNFIAIPPVRLHSVLSGKFRHPAPLEQAILSITGTNS